MSEALQLARATIGEVAGRPAGVRAWNSIDQGADDGAGAGEREGMFARLLSLYPVTARILGPGFFAYAVDSYLDERASGALETSDPCGSLPHYLATEPHCRHLRYVADVARFEGYVHEVAQAAVGLPMDPDRLAGSLSAAHRISFVLSPAYALMASIWPVDRIWLAHGQGQVAALQVSCRLRHFEIWRQDGCTLYRRLATADYRFRRGLQMGVPLAAAAAAALEAERDFDLATALASVLQQGVVTSFVRRPLSPIGGPSR